MSDKYNTITVNEIMAYLMMPGLHTEDIRELYHYLENTGQWNVYDEAIEAFRNIGNRSADPVQKNLGHLIRDLTEAEKLYKRNRKTEKFLSEVLTPEGMFRFMAYASEQDINNLIDIVNSCGRLDRLLSVTDETTQFIRQAAAESGYTEDSRELREALEYISQIRQKTAELIKENEKEDMLMRFIGIRNETEAIRE